jgi:hypothetical protein
MEGYSAFNLARELKVGRIGNGQQFLLYILVISRARDPDPPFVFVVKNHMSVGEEFLAAPGPVVVYREGHMALFVSTDEGEIIGNEDRLEPAKPLSRHWARGFSVDDSVGGASASSPALRSTGSGEEERHDQGQI